MLGSVQQMLIVCTVMNGTCVSLENMAVCQMRTQVASCEQVRDLMAESSCKGSVRFSILCVRFCVSSFENAVFLSVLFVCLYLLFRLNKQDGRMCYHQSPF